MQTRIYVLHVRAVYASRSGSERCGAAVLPRSAAAVVCAGGPPRARAIREFCGRLVVVLPAARGR